MSNGPTNDFDRAWRGPYDEVYFEKLRELDAANGPIETAVPAAASTPVDGRATVQPPRLAREPDILQKVAETMAAAGVAGEHRVVKLIYLAVTSRLLDRIVSLAIKGPSSAGKSYLVQRVLELFPGSAYHALSAMSERALIYDVDTPLAHRMLVLYEAAGMAGELQTYIVRSLLSEGRVRYTTVEKTKDGMRSRTIEREGPTGLLTTTTEIKLHPENETRLLSVTVTDSPAQTKAVLRAHAIGRTDTTDIGSWHDLQEWLQANGAPVEVPFAITLAELIPPVAIRLRRDFPVVLSLVRAHAMLHRASRDLGADGTIIATVEDYSKVRELVADLVADAAERTVSDTMRQTVRAVELLTAQSQTEATVGAVADNLGLDKSAASRRVRSAVERGYLKSLEDRRGRPLRLVLGDPLPDEQTILPEPTEVERLHGCGITGRD